MDGFRHTIIGVWAKKYEKRRVGYLVAVLGTAAVTGALKLFGEHINSTTVALGLLLVVLFVATRWGSRPAVLAPNRGVTVNGSEVHLTPKEYDLMVYLLSHPGKVLTHRTLLAAVWGGTSVEQTEYLRVFIGQLRKKIEPEPAAPHYILTEPWIGYRFDPGSAGQ